MTGSRDRGLAPHVPPTTLNGANAERGSSSMPSNYSTFRPKRLSRRLMAVLLGATALGATAASAQEAPISQNATVNLINRLVDKKVLTRAEADEMIAQAEAEAQRARATAEAAESARTSAETAIAAASPASAQPGTSVRYVPQFVRDQLKEEVRAEVLADAKRDGIVAPDAVPEWVRSIAISGDFRFRDEGRFFNKNNALDFANIGAINSGPPYNIDPVTNPNNPPILNSRKNRNYLRIRARLGIAATIDKDLTAYFRLATGSQNNPVSTNQSLGGFFSNKDIWLDRAYVDFRPTDGGHVWLGRMANPFRLSELVWDDDINLDGVAASYEHSFGSGFSAFALGGAFPLDYVPDDSPAPAKADLKTGAGKDKWLFAGQLGGAWQFNDSVRADLNAAYYHYQNVEGDLSPSCSNLQSYCLTDYSRPGFSQKGNTLFALRDLTTVDPAYQASPQYYGLASKFHVLAISGDLDWVVADGLHLNLAGQYTKNLAYDESEILARGFNPRSGLSQIVNNNETCSVDLVGQECPAGKSVFKSGDAAWLVRATIGAPVVETAGDWNISASYRHIAPDALLDAFTDSDFRLGGTNAKGWTIGGAYGLRRNTWLGLRWLNADEVSGPPFRVNVLQADLNVKF